MNVFIQNDFKSRPISFTSSSMSFQELTQGLYPWLYHVVFLLYYGMPGWILKVLSLFGSFVDSSCFIRRDFFLSRAACCFDIQLFGLGLLLIISIGQGHANVSLVAVFCYTGQTMTKGNTFFKTGMFEVSRWYHYNIYGKVTRTAVVFQKYNWNPN